MVNKPLISIIVPVYNVENYLNRCIQSLLCQSYENIEILLIDDGSTDNSSKICDSYLIKDNRIKLFHKSNGGLSSARNYGIIKSSGEYVTFVDSDDDIEAYYIEYLYDLIKKYNTKMSIASYTVISKNRKMNIGKGFKEELLNTETALSRLLCENGFTVSSCAKLYKKSLFNDVKFPESKLYEDNGTTYKLFLKCKNIAYGEKSIYNYYIRNDSITRNKFNIRKMDYIELVDISCKIIINKYPCLNEQCLYKQAICRANILKILEKKNSLTTLEMKEEKKLLDWFKKNRKKIINNKCSSLKLKIFVGILINNRVILRMVSKFYG